MSTQNNFLHELSGSMSQGAAGNPTVPGIKAAVAPHGLHWRYVNRVVAPEGPGAAGRRRRAMGMRGVK